MMKTAFEEKRNLTSVVGSIVIFMLLILIFWDMADAKTLSQAEIEEKLLEIGSGKNVGKILISKYVNDTIVVKDGYAEENEAIELEHIIEKNNVVNVTFTVKWIDEADADARHTNKPDSFTISVENPDGSLSEEESGMNEQGKEGEIKLTVSLFDKNNEPDLPIVTGTGTWEITISVEAGDQELWRPSIGLQDFQDNGNDFSLGISIEYCQL